MNQNQIAKIANIMMQRMEYVRRATAGPIWIAMILYRVKFLWNDPWEFFWGNVDKNS